MGARRGDILLQFLIESVALALLGGAIGVVFGIAIAKGHAGHRNALGDQALGRSGGSVGGGKRRNFFRSLSRAPRRHTRSHHRAAI
jgi:hypothetical protein